MATLKSIHPTAIIYSGAEIDPSCEIGPFCVVGKDVKLGAGNVLMSHVVMENRTTVGNGNRFFPFCVIGVVPQDLKYEGENTQLIIGNRNTIREAATLNLGTRGGGGVTRVGDDNLLMAYTHLGHDVKIGNHVVLGNSCQIGGHVVGEDYAVIGGMCAISQFIRVGAHSYIGGCSGLDRDVPPFSLGRGIAGDFEVWGVNLVGLKRRGFESEKIAKLQELNKIFFKDKSLEKEKALQRIESELGDTLEIQQFVQFVRSSDKGVYR